MAWASPDVGVPNKNGVAITRTVQDMSSYSTDGRQTGRRWRLFRPFEGSLNHTPFADADFSMAYYGVAGVNTMKTVFAVLAASCLALCAEKSKIHFVIVDAFGKPIKEFGVAFEVPVTGELLSTVSETLSVPYGKYKLTVLAQRFELYQRDVVVNMPEMEMVIGLHPAPRVFRDPSAPPVMIDVKVASEESRSGPPALVRLSSLYSDTTFSAILKGKTVSFADVPLGE
ncbi:MAG: hypothetical protein U0Q16_05055 [Bryobacteraceae bacterium]